jgi:flagellar hook protein FlgE
MGISSALYSGVSGLKTNSHAMSVIGNNLAHTNTVGFKGARTVFSDLLSASVNGSGGSSQIGRGVNLSKVDNIFSQGTFESTESGLDVAIEGDSFFMLKEPGDNTMYYSRAGAFRFDQEGYLVNPEGFQVQGQPYDIATNTLTPGEPQAIQVTDTGLIPANMTTTLELNNNLDAADPLPTTAGFDPADPTSYNYSMSAQIFDSLGNPHLLTTYFEKDGGGVNTWNWHWSAEDSNGLPISGTGAPDLVFDETGIMNPPVGPQNIGGIDWDNGSDPNQDIAITFDTTQFHSASVVISQDQNGFGAGDLTSVDINEEGVVVASYSNGEQVNIAQIALSKFQNPGGLKLQGSNMFVATAAAGAPRTGLPGAELGKIFTNALEQSNVDMGNEFVRMITVQRGFQANSKIITTIDELLGELINLKR